MEKRRNKMIPRPEYPRPQMMREKWLNLNTDLTTVRIYVILLVGIMIPELR